VTDAPRLLGRLSGSSGSFSFFGLFGSFGFFGFPISQPNERDKPNTPDKPVLVSPNQTDQIDQTNEIDLLMYRESFPGYGHWAVPTSWNQQAAERDL
jgi:hypothetical protein